MFVGGQSLVVEPAAGQDPGGDRVRVGGEARRDPLAGHDVDDRVRVLGGGAAFEPRAVPAPQPVRAPLTPLGHGAFAVRAGRGAPRRARPRRAGTRSTVDGDAHTRCS